MHQVLHGDAVFTNDGRRSGILSGDELCYSLSKTLRPRVCVFLASVPGVFDRPPETNPTAQLIHEIRVDYHGKIVNLDCLSAASREHDVTGGLQAKLDVAAKIARLGIPVCVCEGGTVHAREALRGRMPSVCTLLVRVDHTFPHKGDYF